MAGQTCCASETGIQAIRAAMKRNGWRQAELAKECGFSRSTLGQILKGAAVKHENLDELCELLDLEAGQIIEIDELTLDAEAEIEALVKRLREQVAPLIQHDCGEMKVLDMTYPIDSTAIYTDVNILERVTSKSRADLEQLMQDVDAENFDRFCLGQVRERRVPGLEALARHRLLMILGKPGAGKTTFLKRLAMWCRAGKQGLAGRVPIFVTLKECADDRRKPETLIEFVLESHGLTDSVADVEQLLEAGRALVLLDGLDEVQNSEHDRVLAAIREFGRKYGPKGQSLEDEQAQDDQNQVVITCRIAAREYIFERFTEVEVADFQDEQIQDFADKWFLAHEPNKLDEDGASTVGRLFWQELDKNQPVKELATNPLLLTLLCLEFREDYGFPSSRAELYERGLDILFTKWDGTRQIKRNQVYEKLPVMRKKALLSKLAWATFERGDYFFKQAIAEEQIRQYIQNLPGASNDDEMLLLNSKTVLSSIEAHHGLLTQRAAGIYSFSHLTFHEYFSASQIASRDIFPEEIFNEIHNKRYREIFLLVSEKLQNSKSFFLQIKTKNDRLIQENRDIKNFLVCQANRVSLLEDAAIRGISYRAFYCYLSLNSTLGIDHRNKLAPMFDDIRVLIGDRARKILEGEIDSIKGLSDSEVTLYQDLKMTEALALYQGVEQSIDDALERVSYSNYSLIEAYNVSGDRSFDRSINHAYTLFRGVLKILNLIYRTSSNRDLKENILKAISHVQDENLENDESSFIYWWSRGRNRQWYQPLKSSVTHQRKSISQQWDLKDEDLNILRTYYRGCRLLFDCLNSECYVSREVRQQIEDNLLLSPD